ncbi:MAG: amidohydrolase family protein [Armatimonadetes bacterium]|nr:amidohydrolase family protein [Armatimonadota bacterium]MDE2205999.1 amidohydrolase family protein [Armatimonadota bacterium]
MRRPCISLPVLLTLLFPALAHAQLPGLPKVFAIVGARVVVGNGQVLPGATVVIRDGVITAVGANVQPPADARITQGAGLVVYPGFIDALDNPTLDLPAVAADQGVPVDTSDTPPVMMREADRKGVRADVLATRFLTYTSQELAALHKDGFCTALVMPTGGMINGIGGVVTLSGAPTRDIVVNGAAAMGFGFATGGGPRFGGGGPGPAAGAPAVPPYPGTLLGIFATIRQTLLDSQWLNKWDAVYRKYGGQRPPDDPVLGFLHLVFNGMPVVFEANTRNEIYRAIHLDDEFKLNTVIGGGLYAYRWAAMLASRKIPVVVALNFGAEPYAPPIARTAGLPRFGGRRFGGPPGTSRRPDGVGGPGMTAATDANQDVPLAAQRDAQRQWRARRDNAAALARAGATFAFTARGLPPQTDFLTQLRSAVQNGLPADAALRALTIDAARILHIQKQFGTVEVGKQASLTVMTGDFTKSDSTVKYLFIDNKRIEPAKETAGSGAPAGIGGRVRRPTSEDGDQR